jgi:CAAX prenyl protease-like protein
MTFLYFVVGAAIQEEMIFRGLLQTTLARRFPATLSFFGTSLSYAAIVVALLFGLIHLEVNPITAAAAFVLGLLSGELRLRSGSLSGDTGPCGLQCLRRHFVSGTAGDARVAACAGDRVSDGNCAERMGPVERTIPSLRPRVRMPLGLHGALLTLFLILGGVTLSRALDVFRIQFWYAVPIIPIGMGIYDLAWKFLVEFLNKEMGIA